MFKKLLLPILILFAANSSFGQSVDDLKLTDAEIPAGYAKSNEMLCATPHGCSLYTQADMFAGIIGKVKTKTFQAFDKKGDQGSILYFEFESNFSAQTFLAGLLWGEDLKPSKTESDEYYAKNNILVIWSFGLTSEIKKVSKEKVTRMLK